MKIVSHIVRSYIGFLTQVTGTITLKSCGIKIALLNMISSLCYMHMKLLFLLVIFLIYFYITIYVCVPHFYDLSALVGCWSSVSIRRIIYKFLNVCPFDYTAVAVSGKVERS